MLLDTLFVKQQALLSGRASCVWGKSLCSAHLRHLGAGVWTRGGMGVFLSLAGATPTYRIQTMVVCPRIERWKTIGLGVVKASLRQPQSMWGRGLSGEMESIWACPTGSVFTSHLQSSSCVALEAGR